MGVVVKEPFNVLNVIIRAENNASEFLKNIDGNIETMIFNIYTHCFDLEKEFNVEIFLIMSETKNANLEELKGFDIAKYKLNKNGFQDLNDVLKKENHIKKNNISLTRGYRADMRLDMSEIKKLEQGYYEIVVKVDKKIITSYPFSVKNN